MNSSRMNKFLDEFPVYAFYGVVLLFGSCISYGVVGVTGIGEPSQFDCDNYELKTVESIGGCSAFGTCGVKFTDGTFDDVSHPVIGEQFPEIKCIERKEEK